MTGVLYYKKDDGTVVGIGAAVPIPAIASVGEIRFYASVESLPAGFLVCNNAAISRSTYAALFNKIGTQWGAGDGSTTFNLPDLIDRTIRGGNTGGAKGGSADAIIPTHGHTASSGTESADHSHTTDINHIHSAANGDNNSGFASRGAYVIGGSWGAAADGGATGGFWDFTATNWVDSPYLNRGSGGRSAAHTHTITVNNAGESATGKNWPPYGTVVPAIYAGV